MTVELRLEKIWRLLLVAGLSSLLVTASFVPASSTTSVSYNFNTSGQLADNFNSYVVSPGTVVQSTTGGINNTGAIHVSSNSANAVFATKDTYSLGGAGSKYTFSSFLKSVGNSGYSGMGFTGLEPNSSNASGTPYKPNDALGISVHGGGYVWHNGAQDTSGSWGYDLISSFAADPWYFIKLTIELTSDTAFSMKVEVWPSNSSGTLNNANPSATKTITGTINNTLRSAASISSYVNFSGFRVVYFDNYQVDLEGSMVVTAGNPVVQTRASSTADNKITLNGEVTSDGGSPITERGIVYGTSSSPLISGTKVVAAATATFSATTPTLTPGTYFLRAYATNGVGTSYGTEVEIEILGPPVDNTAPTLSSSSPSNGATFVSNTGNVTLTFSESVVAGTGNISFVETNSPSTAIAVDVTSGAVTISGSVVTVNPAVDFELNTSYHVLIDGTAIKDAADNSFSGISNSTTLAFTTAKVPRFGLTVALDAAISTSYSGSGSTTWSDLSGVGNDLTLSGGPTFETPTKAIRFTAANSQYGQFAADDLLNRSRYTKLVWFKPTSFDNLNNLFSSSVKAAHAFWGGGLKSGCNGNGDNLASGHNGQWQTVISQECMETEWQLGAVTFDSDPNSDVAGWKLYRNGSLVGQDDDLTVISSGNLGYKTRIASYSTGNFFDGLISQVYLYDRALTEEEIDEIFEATSDYFGLDLKTVTFNPGGGSVVPTTLRTQVATGQVTLPLPTKANGSFLGWYTEQTGGTRIGGAGDTYTPSASTTIYAQWANSFTVTYSAGTNATVTPASANYLSTGSALTLPTPSRADYVFEGWYSAASGGTKVGNAGATYTPSADVTLHGRWVQASLAGIAAADLVEVNSTTIQNGVSSSNTHTIGSSSVSLSIPAGALAADVVVKLYSVANHNRAQSLLPNESNFVNSMVVSWLAPDSTVPTASSPITLTITDPNIRSGAKIYSIVGDQTTLLATASQNGSVTISITTDPLITIANPVVSQNPGGGGGSGGGGITPAPAPVPSAPQIPQTEQPKVSSKSSGKLEFSGSDLSKVTSVKLGTSDLKFTLDGDQKLSIEIPKLSPGTYTLDVMHPSGKLELKFTVEGPVQKVSAGSFRGVAAVYLSGYAGQRLSVKLGRQWIVVPSLDGEFVRLVRPIRSGSKIRALIYIDRKLIDTLEITAK